MDNKKKRAIVILIGTVAFLVALYFMARPMIDMVSDPDAIKAYIESTGAWGLVAFSLMNMMQVLIAFIPGGPFSFAAGYIWGVWLGTLICIVSTSIMSVIVFLIVRRFGRAFVDLFIPESESQKFNKLLRSDRVRQLLFIIYLVPASPKDPLAYLAGLTNITVLDWAVINLIGRFPGTFITALGAKSIEEGNLVLAGAVFAAAIILYLLGRSFYNKKIKKEAEE
ncbi:MAG: TVP38/TMEM64 family protein [Oscillospiraceae bacterium]|nr:TVP38/TMEM64 family protein [Oscillospiraceae bacterium]